MLKKNKNKFFIGLALSVVLCAGIFLAVGPYLSQGVKAITIDDVGATIGLGAADLKQTIINIIKWALGLLGLVAVIYIMYGGFVWMTAAGNIDKVRKAKRIIIQGVIGLIIILLAWAIVSFVIQTAINATNPNGGGGGGGGTFSSHFIWTEAQTIAGSPPNDDVYLCSRIKSIFNNRIAEASVTGNNHGTCVASPSTSCTSDIDCAVGDTCDLSGTSVRLKIVDMTNPANPVVGGVWTVRTDTLTFRLPPGDSANLWTANNHYQLRIPNHNAGIYSLYDSSPDQTRLDTIASSFLGTGSDYFYFDFHTGSTVDDINPTLDGANTYPRYYAPPESPITSSDRNVSTVPIFRFPFSEDIDIDSIADAAGHPSTVGDDIIGDFILERLDGPRGNVVNPDGTPGNTPYDNTKLEVRSDAVTHGFAVHILNQGADKLAPFTWYRITLRGVEDLCGNQMNPITSWEFETNDDEPSIDSLDPPDGATNVCPNATINVTFGTSMYYETVTMHVTGGGLNFTLSVNPSSDGPVRSVMVGGQRVDIEVMDFDNSPTQNDNNKWFSIHPGPASTFQLPINSDIDVDITTSLVMDINGNTLGKNDWNFSVSDLDTCACSPFIGQIQPASGPRSQCVTIRGGCFAGTSAHPATVQSLIFSDPDNAPENITGTVNGSGQDYLVSTIPDDFQYNDRARPQITIVYDEPSYGTASTNNIGTEYYVSDSNQANGPCLFSLSPSRGRAGIDTVTLNGIRFEEAEDTVAQDVTFRDPGPPFEATVNNVGDWSDTVVRTVISSLAHGAPDPGLQNFVYLHNDNGNSNMLPMNIYTPLPGQPYVISHGPVCTNACINTMIWAEFNTDMNQASVENATSLNTCNDPVGDPNCLTAYAPIAGGIDFNWPSASRAEINAVSGNLSPNQKYRVIIGNGAQNTEGGSLTRLNFNGNSFSWVFTTRDNADPCAVQSVVVAPADRTEMINRTIGYSAQAYGPPDTCNSPINPGAWGNWFSAADPGTTYFDFQNQNNNRVDVHTVAATGGVIDISVQADSVTGSGNLTIVDCNADIDCQARCLAQTGFANNSRCVSGRCTPVVGYLSPHPEPNTTPVSGSGPKDALVTIQGCFFGNKLGSVDFAGTVPEYACGSAGWSDTQIIVRNPLSSGRSGPVSVTTSDGLRPRVGDTKNFTATDQCTTTGIPVPVTGMPGICPPFDPVNARVGQSITFSANNNGYNLWGIFNSFPPTAKAEFTDISGNFVNGVNGQGAGTAFKDNIPSSLNITSGNARVAVRDNTMGENEFCPSNELYLPISCSNAGDCASGCCKETSLYGRICRPFAECSTGGEGELCRMSDNPNCQDGPVVSPGNFQCISSTGDTSSKDPTPSEGDDCRVCCSMDSNNDNVYNDPQVSSSGLVCTADQGACSSLANPGRRGLYCGCTSDSQCPVGQGCSPVGERCCYDKPRITSVDNNVCRNGVITINFNTLMDTSTLNKENIKVFYDNGNSTTCLSGTPFFSMAEPETKEGPQGKLGMIFDRIKNFISPTAQAAVSQPLPVNRNWCPVDIWLANRTENGHTVTIIGPNGLLPGNTTIGIVVKGSMAAGGGVYSSQRLAMSDGLNFDFDPQDSINDSYSSIYQTGPDICQLDHVSVTGTPAFSWPLNDLFTCAGLNTCPGDSDTAAGNQHTYVVRAYDQGNHEIAANENNWSVEDLQDVVEDLSATNLSQVQVTSKVKNGLAFIKAQVTAYGMTKSATVKTRVNLCEHPWPNPFVGEHFPFEDSFNFRQPDTVTGNGNIYTNFAISYCKDPGGLPTISSILVKNGNADINNDKYQELVKEYFFLFDDTQPNKDDVIGIRVMENVLGLSPMEWYRQQFGPAAPEPQALTVDGYPAVRAGRTVYVSALNIVCNNNTGNEVDCLDATAVSGDYYYNIYLISYNEGAIAETIDIYNRLLQNWEFNVNVSRTDREKMWRDMKRLNDLNDIYAKMLDYKTANGHFPRLEGGTFIQGLSTSKWPSWQDTLGAALGGSLPVDPINNFSPITTDGSGLCDSTNGFNDPNTCWNQDDKIFQVPADSHLYMYVVGPSGDFANLYTKMEYLGVGNWINYHPAPPEPCDGNSFFCDNVFNFEFLLSGNLQDHAGPTITAVTYQTNDLDGLPVAGSGPIEVTADDPSGVNRVEFYINGTKKYTDIEMSDGWIWNFDSGQYADGGYELIARAYDNMGNRRDRRANFTINNSVGFDSVPPFVQIISHHDGDRISGTVNFIAVASDNVQVFDTWIRAFPAAFCNPENPNPCDPANRIFQRQCRSPHAEYCSFNWDSTAIPNGGYVLEAVAMDFPVANISVDRVAVNVDNTDTDPPNVTLINFSGNGKCALGTCAGNGNTCSVLSIHSCSDGSVCNRSTCTSDTQCSALPNPLNPAETLTNRCQMGGIMHVEISADDTQSNITRVIYSVDGVVRHTDDVTDGLFVTSSWDWNTEEVSNTNPLVAPPPHNLTITAYDSYGHRGSVSVDIGTFNESTDTIAPTISFVERPPDTNTPSDYLTVGGPFNIVVSATDNLNAVDYVDFYFDYVYRRTVQGPLSQYTYEITQEFINQLSSGCHTFSARAVDTAGNARNSEVRHIGVRQNCYGQSGQGPRIVSDGSRSIVEPHSVRVGDVVTIRARVSDPDGVASVIAYIQNPDEQDPPTATITMTCVEGPCTTDDRRLGIYQGTWRATGSLNPYYVDIVAIDNIGQRSEAENVF